MEKFYETMNNRKTVKYLLTDILFKKASATTPNEASELPKPQEQLNFLITLIHTASNNILRNNPKVSDGSLSEEDELKGPFYAPLTKEISDNLIDLAKSPQNQKYALYARKLLNIMQKNSGDIVKELKSRMFLNKDWMQKDQFPIMELAKQSHFLLNTILQTIIYSQILSPDPILFMRPGMSMIAAGVATLTLIMSTNVKPFYSTPKDPGYTYGIQSFTDFAADHPAWLENTWNEFVNNLKDPMSIYLAMMYLFIDLIGAICINGVNSSVNNTQFNATLLYLSLIIATLQLTYTIWWSCNRQPQLTADDIAKLEDPSVKARFQAIDDKFLKLIIEQPLPRREHTSQQQSNELFSSRKKIATPQPYDIEQGIVEPQTIGHSQAASSSSNSSQARPSM